MLVFLDDSYRNAFSTPNKSLGMLCGIAIPEAELSEVVVDIYQLKYNHLGEDYAKNKEIKGKDLLKQWVFKLDNSGTKSHNLALANDIIEYILSKGLIVFGCVCFEEKSRGFKCVNVKSLDKTFIYLFERIDTYLKLEHPSKFAKIIFDDRDYDTNRQNSEAITNFFVRSPQGLAMDRIIKTPFFAISQAQNVGLQLADFVTTVIGQRFSGIRVIDPYWKKLKQALYRWDYKKGVVNTSLKVIK